MISHEPVLLDEVIRELHIKNQGRYIDATLGAGGYTNAILDAGGSVLGIDTDISMLGIARENVRNGNAKLVHGNFKDLKKIAEENRFTEIEGVVFDLGVSNIHFSDSERGFSFKNPNASLDMRLDIKSQSIRASDLLNALRQDQLEQILGKKIAEKVVEYRKVGKFDMVGDFLSLFENSKKSKIHPATRSMMMLRIAVNSELDNLREVLPQAYELLKPGGKLVVVSFHSLEDGIVKDFMKNYGGSEPIRPSDQEVNRNPKSRSAILRVVTKL